MKLVSICLVIGLAIVVVADLEYASASPHYWDDIDPIDIAPPGCAKPTAYFNCYKVVSKYAYCDAEDSACSCSSVMIDLNCFNQDCGTSIQYDYFTSSLYCTGTATIGMSAGVQKTPNPVAPARTDATPTPTDAPGGSGKPNAGERAIRVSLFAAAVAAAGLLL